MNERKIFGVCAWLADKFALDVIGLRILFVVATFLAFGSLILVYFVLFLIKPKQY